MANELIYGCATAFIVHFVQEIAAIVWTLDYTNIYFMTNYCTMTPLAVKVQYCHCTAYKRLIRTIPQKHYNINFKFINMSTFFVDANLIAKLQ